MKRIRHCVLVLLFVAFNSAGAQTQQFEVASVKPTRQPGGVRQACHGTDSKILGNDPRALAPLGRCVVVAGRLSHMIGMAYDVPMDMLRGGPEWVATGNDRFDVEARVEDPTSATESQLMTMFQTLLADRFKLKFHREPHDSDGFALVVARNGLKVKEAAPDEPRKLEIRAGGSDFVDAIKGAPNGVLIQVNAQRISMADVVGFLRPYAQGHIIDETNLKGVYNFKLEWEAGQSISGPLQSQLGLRLESRKVPIDYIIIDYAEKPVNP